MKLLSLKCQEGLSTWTPVSLGWGPVAADGSRSNAASSLGTSDPQAAGGAAGELESEVCVCAGRVYTPGVWFPCRLCHPKHEEP